MVGNITFLFCSFLCVARNVSPLAYAYTTVFEFLLIKAVGWQIYHTCFVMIVYCNFAVLYVWHRFTAARAAKFERPPKS